MKSVHSCLETLGKLSVPLLVPGAFSRTQTVVDIRFFFEIACDHMRLYVIACDLMRSHGFAWDRMRSRIIPFSGRIEFDLLPLPRWNKFLVKINLLWAMSQRSHSIAWDRMLSHAIACNRMKSQTLCRQLSEFLKMHREREAGQKVCLKCFFTTTVNRFHIIFFAFSKRKK